MSTNQGIDEDQGEHSNEDQPENKLISPTNQRIQGGNFKLKILEDGLLEMPQIALFEQIPQFQVNHVDVAQIDDHDEIQKLEGQSQADDNIMEGQQQNKTSGESNNGERYNIILLQQPTMHKFQEIKLQSKEPSSQPSSHGNAKHNPFEIEERASSKEVRVIFRGNKCEIPRDCSPDQKKVKNEKIRQEKFQQKYKWIHIKIHNKNQTITAQKAIYTKLLQQQSQNSMRIKLVLQFFFSPTLTLERLI